MRILVTGGAGYIGSACLRWLVQCGHDPIAYDDLSEGNASAVPESRLVEGDIRDTDRLAAAMASHGVEGVMHFAALASVPDSIGDPDRYYDINLYGTKCVLDAMRRAGVSRIVFSSTAAVYGFKAEMPLVEDSLKAPEVPYGTTKYAAERLIQDYSRAYGLGYAILRYFNASGADPDGRHGEARRSESHLIPLILAVAVGKREKVMIYGTDYDTPDGTCVRDFVHTADLAQAHQIAVERLEPGLGLVYNLGTGTGVSVLEVLRACEAAVGRPIAHEFAPRRPGDPATLVASPRRIVEEQGWSPRWTEIEGIVETAWRWHKSHPDGYGPHR